jgi:hypothetical protein
MLAYNAFYGGRHATVNVQPDERTERGKMTADKFLTRGKMKRIRRRLRETIFRFAQSGRRFFTLPFAVAIMVVIAGEQILHDADVVVARVVQARKPESTFDCLEQREVGVTLRALHAMDTVVGIHDR